MTRAIDEPEFDLRTVPFSRYGSYFAFSVLPGALGRTEGLFLRSVHGDPGQAGTLFRIELLRNGAAVPFQPHARASVLSLEGRGAGVEICIPEAGKIRLRGAGAGLRLKVDPGQFDYDCAVHRGGSRWQISSFTNRIECLARPLRGTLRVELNRQALWPAASPRTPVSSPRRSTAELPRARDTHRGLNRQD